MINSRVQITIILYLCIVFVTIFSCTFKNINPDISFAKKEYAAANKIYLSQYPKINDEKSEAQLAFKIAQCFQYQADYNNSLAWYKIAYEKNYGLKALEQYAYGLKQAEDYDEAIEAFQKLIIEVQDKTTYRKEITICKLAKAWRNDNSNSYYQIKPLTELNSEENDLSACYDRMGNIYFSSDRIGATGNQIYGWSGGLHFDIYKYDVSDQSVRGVNEINSKHHEANPCIVKNKSLYFVNCSKNETENSYCQIWKSKWINSKWQSAEQIDLENDLCNNLHPAVHESDSILIFSSDRKNGQGKFDLYISYIQNDNWSTPEALPNYINTEGNERFPTWYKDTVFFSSDFLPGMGGLDIFKTYRMKNGKWAAPINLKSPINSGSDDYGLQVNPSFYPHDDILQKGIFTSNRTKNNHDDIFDYELIKREINATPKKDFEVRTNVKFIIKSIIATKNDFYLDSVNVTNNNTGATINLLERYAINYNNLSDGNYTFEFTRQGYYPIEEIIDINQNYHLNSDTILTVIKEIIMVPLINNQEFVLQNIYYDFDDWKLKIESYDALNQLVNLMRKNPELKLEIRSHTDCRGNESYNTDLSLKRAESVVQYLINQSIDNTRLNSVGLGESEPLQKCDCDKCSESEHAVNRRTSFLIK